MLNKKPVESKAVFAFCFLGFMAVMGAVCVFQYVSNYMLTGLSTSHLTPTVTSFSEQYPFDTSEEESQSKQSYAEIYSEYVQKLETYVESFATNKNVLTKPFLNLLNKYDGATQKEVYLNGSSVFVKLPNGYLTECFSYCPSEKIQDNLLDFSEWLRERDIPLVMQITPDKSDDSVAVFPEGIPHGYSQMFREYTAFLDQNDIAYLDAKAILLSKNSDFYSWFYKADHHWNVRAAFETAASTANYLNDELHIPANTSVLNRNHFKSTVYPNSFLGSYASKLGDSWKEDMEILYPTAKTDFHIEIPSLGIDKTGRFEDTLIRQNKSRNEVSYGDILYGDQPLIRIENKSCQNGTRVLVIRKSFGEPMCPYLASTVQYLDVIDPRHFDGSIRSFIEQTKPDVVIACMGVVYADEEDYLTFK